MKKTVKITALTILAIGAVYGSLQAWVHFHRYLHSLEQETPVESVVEVAEADPRIEALENYLEGRESPLAGEAKTFIEVADLYGYDWTLLPAISIWESGGGIHTPSCAEFNPFGWTSTSSPCGFWRFDDFGQAIRHVAEKISTLPYYANFRTTGEVKDIAENYNKVRTSMWIEKVTYFQEAIKNEN